MERHFRALGYLFIIYAFWVLISVLIVAFAPGLVRARPSPTPAPTAIVTAVVFVALYSVTGWALLARRDWARPITIIASIIALLSFPLGTALGIYGLWAMFSSRGMAEFGTYTRPRPPGEPMPE